LRSCDEIATGAATWSFSKLLAGAVTAAGMHGTNAAESKPALQKRVLTSCPLSGSYSPRRSPDDDHGAMVMVVMAIVMVVVIVRLRVSGSREEGDDSK
jgi:hypothetical protein